MPDYFRVKEPFAYGNLVAAAGQIWSSDNPAFKGREQYFEPVETTVARAASVTETASAAPGEVRARKPAFKKAAPKPAEAIEVPKPETVDNPEGVI